MRRVLLTASLAVTLGTATRAGAVTCTNPRYDLETLAFQTAQRYTIPPALFVAMVGTESHFCTAAVSPKGALGLGQIMPGTARDLGLTLPFDAAMNLDASARYLKALFGVHHDWSLTLAAYNAGSANVTKYGGVPPFTETQNHVNLILLRANALNAQIPLVNVLNTSPEDLNAALQSARPQLLGASQTPGQNARTAQVPVLQTLPNPAVQRPAPPAPRRPTTTAQTGPAAPPTNVQNPAQDTPANVARPAVSPVTAPVLTASVPVARSGSTPGITSIRPAGRSAQSTTSSSFSVVRQASTVPTASTVPATGAGQSAATTIPNALTTGAEAVTDDTGTQDPQVPARPAGQWSSAVIIHGSGR